MDLLQATLVSGNGEVNVAEDFWVESNTFV